MTRLFVLVCCLVALLLPANAFAIQLQPIASGFASPVYVTHAGDGSGRLFIVEQPGVIKVLAPGAAVGAVFLDITDRVLFGGERGLLGLAFHPLYETNGRFFVNYTRKPDGATVLAEYARSADPNVALHAEIVLLTLAQPFANHNGGMIEFGHDGYLYVGKGDGGSSNDPNNRAQNIDDLLGKILRIDVNGASPYQIPADNPFAGATPGRDEIYAVGLRNPFRFSFDRGTGQLIVGDVGQNMWEEIDLVTRGANLGWRVFEGNHCTNLDPLCGNMGFTPPIAEYFHAGGRCSVTGGYVYRGSLGVLPVGTYVFGDFCTGEIFTLNGGTATVLLDTSINISSFGEDETGELYVVGLGGAVYRLVSEPGISQSQDFDGEGTTDVLWRHSSGLIHIWFMNAGVISSFANLATVMFEWTIQGVGDFNNDGNTDILWRHTSGLIHVWFMRATSIVGKANVAIAQPEWTIQGVGDFNNDGNADILWRHTSGVIHIWFMNGGLISSTVTPGTVASDWTIRGVGDFNNDGTADVLWRHTSGVIHIWFMNAGLISGTATPDIVAPEWTVQRIGDFNNDGTADVLWRHTSGVIHIWFMNAGVISGTATPGTAPPDWTIRGIGDFNNDGNADVLWRHTTGFMHIWFTTAGMISGTANPATVAPEWTSQ